MMFYEWIDAELARQLLIAAGHSLWLGLIVIAFSMLVTRVMRRAPAKHRYAVQLSLLAVLAILPIIAFVVLRPQTLPKRFVSASEASMVANDGVIVRPAVGSFSIPEEILDASPDARGSRRVWAPPIVAVYLLGVLLALLRTMAGLRGGMRLCRTAQPITDANFHQRLLCAARRIGIRSLPKVGLCIEIAVPTVVGIIRPMILIPPAALTGLTPTQLEAVLAHELAHIQRFDPLVNLLQRLIEALLFFHPAVWCVSRRVRIERELCCDERASGSAEQRAIYAQSLLAVAQMVLEERSKRARPASDGLSVVGTKRSRLRERIESLLAPPALGEFRMARLWMLVGAVMVVMCVSTLSLHWGNRVAAREPTTQPGARDVKILTLDAKTHQPLAKVRLEPMNGSEAVGDASISDESGVAVLHLWPGMKNFAWVSASAEGRVPMEIHWYKKMIPTLPDSLTIELAPAVSLSGRVLDDQGNTVEGATVMVSVMPDRMASPPKEQTVEQQTSHEGVVTDANGNWKIDGFPETLGHVQIGAMHPTGGGNEQFLRFLELSGDPLVKQTGDRQFDLLLRPGRMMTGRITDPSGKPVSGALVRFGSGPFASNAIPEQTTDESGQYALSLAEKTSVPISVWAKGLAPETATLRFDAPSSTLDIQLKAATPLHGTITDIDGKPVAGAIVSIGSWRGMQYPGPRFTTDSEGRFNWDDAPADEVELEVLSRNYAAQRNVRVMAGEEVRIALQKTVTFDGTVIDAKTREPIDNFRVLEGYKADGKPTIFPLHNTPVQPERLAPGKFRFKIAEANYSVVYGVIADGYRIAESPIAALDRGDQNFTFELVRADGVKGKVVKSDGSPLAEMSVYLIPEGELLTLTNGELQDHRARQFNTSDTNEQGEFSFQPTVEKYRLLVVCDEGFALVPDKQFLEEKQITLQPWATITGIARSGDSVAPNAPIQASIRNFDASRRTVDMDVSNEATADAEGRFTISRLMSGTYYVGKLVRIPRGQMSVQTIDRGQRIDIDAGKNYDVTIGGGGRTVTGSLKLPDGVDPALKGSAEMLRLITHAKRSSPPAPPKPWQTMTDEEKKAYAESPEMKEFRRKGTDANANRTALTAGVKTDNTFQFEDVPPGEYELRADFAFNTGSTPNSGFMVRPVGSPEPAPSRTAGTIGQIHQVINVPEGDLATPVNLEPVIVTLRSSLRVGMEAPAFEVPSLEAGKTFKLSDYKGKLVLLDFWATWCGPCKEQLPYLKRVYERFGEDPRFVLISLSLDETQEPLKKFIEQEKMEWTHGFLGPWTNNRVTEAYGVRGIPSTFVIGPDGKIIASGLWNDSIEQTVSAALSRMPK